MRASLATLFALLLATPLAAGELVARPQAAVVPGEYLVTFRPAAVAAARQRVATDLATASLAHRAAGAHRGQVVRVFQHALQGALVRLPDAEAARALAARPDVLRVEPNGVVYASGTQNGAPWGLDRVDQRDLPLSGTYTYASAANVNVYVIDTGIRTSHGQFGGRAVHGIDTIDRDGNASDCNGHGTHVAGTVGAAYWGVAKDARLVAVRVLDCNGSGSDADVIAGVDWVTAHHVKPAVANMSLGGSPSRTLDAAVRASIAAGVTYVVAAGNEKANACNSSPARVGEAITVGATGSNDTRASFSNYGSCVDLFAPGVGIRSVWHSSNRATETLSGTSMASPHVAGAAALYLAANPGASPAQVAAALVAAATPGKVGNAGSGSPNRLLYAPASGAAPEPPPPTGGDDEAALANDVPVAVSDGAGGQRYFYVDVPAGQASLTLALAGGSGDADLHVRFGARPTTSAWTCRPYRPDSNESCTFANPAAGRWWVLLDAYTAYSATLRATWAAAGDGGACPGPEHAGWLSAGESAYLPEYVAERSGRHAGALDGPSGADFDLYLQKWNGFFWTSVKASTGRGPDETVSYDGGSGYYRWRVHAYAGSGRFSLCTQRP